jgi:PAS domain-containing protein
MYELRALMGMLGMNQTGRRRAIAADTGRERRELDQGTKRNAEVFCGVPLPMASCDRTGRVRSANPAFLAFLNVAESTGIELRDTAFPDVCPTLMQDLEAVAESRRQIKRVIALSEGGDRIVEAAVLLTPAPSTADVTAGEVYIALHPLRPPP